MSPSVDNQSAPVQSYRDSTCCAGVQDSSGPAFAGRGLPSPLAFIGLLPGDAVVVLGAVGESETLFIAARVGPRGRVIDVRLAETPIERIRVAAVVSRYDNVEVRRGVPGRLPISTGSVDWAIANCMIDWTADRIGTFAEIERVLNPGGRLLVGEIFLEPGAAFQQKDLPHGSCLAAAESEERYTIGLRTCGLTDIAVGGRYVFDRDQLAGLGAGTAHIAEQLAGRVWSAWFSARKPQVRESKREASIKEVPK